MDMKLEDTTDEDVRKRRVIYGDVQQDRTPTQEHRTVNESEAETFVKRFEEAWGAREGVMFLNLWHPEGKLHSPFYDRVILGRELAALNDFQRAAVPNLTWKLVGWTWREDTVVVEWENSNTYGERLVKWRGVDKFTLRDGRIVEEVVYADVSLLHGLRAGKPPEPLLRLPQGSPV